MARRLAVLLLLVPSLAFADARAEARKRFKQGMTLIHDGQLEEGIHQLLDAYALKPHPNVLFNVAKAFEAAGKPTDALTYYRRYLSSDPPDASDVRAAIARLDAQLPKHEVEPLRSAPATPAPEPKTPVDEAALARLEALAQKLEAALRKEDERNPAPEQAKDEPKRPADLSDEETTAVPYEETVVTASRGAQSTLESPSATTVITAEEIRMSGARSLPELLRRVPGAEVMVMGVTSANVSFRGFNQRIANKVLVLVDGRPEYEDFLGITLWSAIPIELSEIERIEIIRGPGSALYGANAMMGVINIITRTPGTGAPAEFSAWGGNGAVAGASAVISGGTKLRYRASAAYDQADKYSRDYSDDRADVAPQVSDTWLGYRSAHANAVATYSFDRDFSVSASGGVNRIFSEIYPIGILRNFYLDGIGGYAKADATLGPVKLKVWWETMSAQAGPQYWPIGTRSIATTFQSNVFDFEALFQKEFQALGRHRIAIGASSRLKRLAWTYTGDLKQELHAAAFAQEEWQPIRPVTLTASYRIDRHPLLDNGQPGYAQSPRVSAVWQFLEGHALRASFSTAFREPTFTESYTDLATPIPGVNGASIITQGNTTLKPERLLAFEVGYRGEAPRYGLEWELSLYQNYVSDLIELSAVTPVQPSQAYDPVSASYILGHASFVNDPTTYIARGVELGFTWSAAVGLDVRLSAAFQQVVSMDSTQTVCGPCSEAPVAKLFGGVTYRTPIGLDVGVDAAFVSGTIWVEREPDPNNVENITNLQNPLAAYLVLNARVGYRLFDDRLSLAVVGSQLGPQHQEHPFGNEISQRVMATVTVRP